MNIIVLLAPVSLILALCGLGAFWWTFKSRQYDDPKGDASRVLYDHLDDGPPPPAAPKA
jgi:cbb3-type cytochrome oxidase maturation protein